jgi:hypothetical protein
MLFLTIMVTLAFLLWALKLCLKFWTKHRDYLPVSDKKNDSKREDKGEDKKDKREILDKKDKMEKVLYQTTISQQVGQSTYLIT